jgi:predicted DNA binding CopG/RHH family protein
MLNSSCVLKQKITTLISVTFCSHYNHHCFFYKLVWTVIEYYHSSRIIDPWCAGRTARRIKKWKSHAVKDHPDQENYPGQKKEIEAINATARKTFVKDKRIAIRLYEHDYQGIQKNAMKMGVPYQTLIPGIIHRYIEGELLSKTG